MTRSTTLTAAFAAALAATSLQARAQQVTVIQQAPQQKVAVKEPAPSQGVYNQPRWSQFTIGQSDIGTPMSLTAVRMFGRSAGLRLSTDGGLFNLTEEERSFSITSNIGLDLYLIQPSGLSPFGLYVSGQYGFGTHYHGKNPPSGWAKRSRAVTGEVGAYMHLGDLLIPTAVVRLRQTTLTNGSDSPLVQAGMAQEVVLGVDLNLDGFKPGVRLAMANGQQKIAFALSF